MAKKSYLLISLLIASPSLLAASFDCSKAGTTVEKMICADEQVSKLDSDLSSAYKGALEKTESKDRLKQEQLKWLKERNQCATADCLVGVYKARVGILNVASQNSANSKTNADASSDGFKGEPDMQSVTIVAGKNNEVCRVFLDYIKTIYRKGDCYLRPYPKDSRWKVPELHKTDMKNYEEQEIAYATKNITDQTEILRLTNRYKTMNKNGERAAWTLKFDYDNDGKLNDVLYGARLSEDGNQCRFFGGSITPLSSDVFDYSKLKEDISSGIPFVFDGASYLGNDESVDLLRDKKSEESGIYVNGKIYIINVCGFAH